MAYLLAQDVARLKETLPPTPEPLAQPVLIMVSGLPGSGKSFFCRKLAERLPLLVLESDSLRQALFPQPSYSPEESARLFVACHRLLDELLQRGVPAILDATNLEERHREQVYRIAYKAEARLIIVQLTAPEEIVRQRLEGRGVGKDSLDQSTAGWQVYRRMKFAVQPIRRSYFQVDTSRDITPALEKIVRQVRRLARI